MLVLAALGGRTLLQHGEPLTPGQQRPHIRNLVTALSPVCTKYQMVIAYGNGPVRGLLALETAEYARVEVYSSEALAAQTEMAIGHMIQQELGNLLPLERPCATIGTTVEVDLDDPAFERPTTFIGPMYLREEAERVTQLKRWEFKPDGDKWRRVIASPQPKRIVELRPIRWLMEHGAVIIAAGGGGIPVMRENGTGRVLAAVDCAVDPDLAWGLLARELGADVFVMLTDVDAVYDGWGTPSQNAIRRASPDALATMSFAAATIGPKITAACRFATATGNRAAIGAAADLDRILAGTAGTTISVREAGIAHAGSVTAGPGGHSTFTQEVSGL